MDKNFLSRLRCPQTGQRLNHQAPSADSLAAHNYVVSQDRRYRYPIRNGIPRFVPQSNYADNFGMQWNHFAKTQLDSHSGHPISAERFWKATGWNPADMKDKWVLDVGCGSGRFAEIALSTGAHVVALDYSSAVDACWENLKHHPRLDVVQGDIYSLPFAPESFDYVYSLGVLQHTPDVAKAFASLPPMIVGGGAIVRRLL
jgi:SAM-dependent methyltransferase